MCLLLFIFLYEETVYTPKASIENTVVVSKMSQVHEEQIQDGEPSEPQNSTPRTAMIDNSIPRKSYSQRLALFSSASGSWRSVFRHTYQPFVILFTFPAITYSGLIYGTIIAWLVAIVNVYSIYFTLPPYNFGSVRYVVYI